MLIEHLEFFQIWIIPLWDTSQQEKGGVEARLHCRNLEQVPVMDQVLTFLSLVIEQSPCAHDTPRITTMQYCILVLTSIMQYCILSK